MKTYAEINAIALCEEAGMRKNAGDQINTAFAHGFKKGEQIGYEEGLKDGRRQGVAIDGDKRYWDGYHAAQEDGKKIYQKGYEDGARCQDEVQYQHGFEDAWNMLKDICLGGRERLLRVFGTISITQIITDNTAAEAKAKIDAWGQKKQQTDDEIKVGDEVVYRGEKTVILLVNGDYIRIMYSDGTTNRTYLDSITKTGRHFDGIEEMMKQMRGEVDG